MKRPIFALLALVSGFAEAADPVSAALTVRRLLNQKEVARNWETSWGSYDRDISRSLALDVSIRNMRSTPAEVTLEVLFVARPITGSTRWVFDSQSQDITLTLTNFHTIAISKPLDASIQNYAALGERSESGADFDGYIVRVLSGTNLIKLAASSYPLTKIGASQPALDELVAEGRRRSGEADE